MSPLGTSLQGGLLLLYQRTVQKGKSLEGPHSLDSFNQAGWDTTPSGITLVPPQTGHSTVIPFPAASLSNFGQSLTRPFSSRQSYDTVGEGLSIAGEGTI